jgi:hypothetical protein
VSENQMKQWVAHIHLESGVALELKVWDTNRQMAVNQAYQRANLTGPTDPKIKLFKLEPVLTVADAGIITPEVPKRDKTKDKRYRVRLFVSPMARDMKTYNLRTCDADNALWSVMSMFRVTEVKNLGPYCVEELREHEWHVVKYNQIHNFRDTGRIVDNYDPPPKTTPSRAEDDGVISGATLEEDWADALAAAFGEPPVSRLETRTAAAERFVTKVSSIFDGETTVPLPSYSVKME